MALKGGDKLVSIGYDPASDLVRPTALFGLNGGPNSPTESKSIMKVKFPTTAVPEAQSIIMSSL